MCASHPNTFSGFLYVIRLSRFLQLKHGLIMLLRQIFNSYVLKA
jgi:hypothetical protein